MASESRPRRPIQRGVPRPERGSADRSPTSPAPGRQVLAYGIGAALLAVAGVWHRVVFLGETNVLRDALGFTGPAYDAVATAMRNGRLPEWWDAVGIGTTLAGNPIHCAFHPVAWLLLPIPRIGGDLFVLFHLVCGGVGAALLAARLGADRRGAGLAAILYAASGYVVSVTSSGMAPVVAWMPWIAWASDRLASAPDRRGRARAAVVLALVWALQLLPGEPGHTISAGWLMVLVVLARQGLRGGRTIAWAAAAIAVALLLDAAVAFPALAHLGVSTRAGGVDEAMGGTWSMSPWRVVELLWPGALGRPMEAERSLGGLVQSVSSEVDLVGDAWAMSVFFGAAPLVLASLGAAERFQKRLLAASGVFVVLAMGIHTPLYGVYRDVFVPERLMRFPEKHLSGAIVLWSALAGAGLTRVLAASKPIWIRRVTGGAAAALTLALAVYGLSSPAGAFLTARHPGLDGEGALRAVAVGGVVVAASVGLLAAAMLLVRRGLPRAALGVALVAACGPLGWDSTHDVLTAPRARVAAMPPVLDFILTNDREARPGPAGARLARGSARSVGARSTARAGPVDGEVIATQTVETLHGNIATRFGFGIIPGADSGQTRLSDRFLVAIRGMDGESLARLAGVRWILFWAEPGARSWRPPAYSPGEGWRLVNIPDARPRAFVAPRWFTAGQPEVAIDQFAEAGRAADLGRVAVEGLDPSPPERAGVALSPCSIEAPAPEAVTLTCWTREGGIAVMLDELAPGWTATLDGAPAEILRVDGVFRGVPVGPGPHRVAFRYRAPGLRAGLAVSAVAWATLAVIAGVLWLRRAAIDEAHAERRPRGPGTIR